jgi:hypothetical protein
MPQCKSCGLEMTKAAAGASIFALSFLPLNARTRASLYRPEKIKLAEKIGPLCPKCLERRKDLAS